LPKHWMAQQAWERLYYDVVSCFHEALGRVACLRLATMRKPKVEAAIARLRRRRPSKQKGAPLPARPFWRSDR